MTQRELTTLSSSDSHKYIESFLAVACIVFMGLLTIYFSPFGISNRLDNYSQDLFNKFFGKYEFIYPTTGQQKVSVLLLTDQTVDGHYKGKWPISYSAHARILTNLLRHSPKAVIIDFLWLNQEKPGIEHLLRVLKRFKAKDIPVYLTFRKIEEIDRFWPELKGLVLPITPNIAVDPSDFIARNYVFKHNDLLSPAARIYRDLYDKDFAIDNNSGMQIFWGMRTNQKNAVWMDRGDKEDNGVDMLLEGFSAVKYNPPYTTTVLVRDLLHPIDENDEAAFTDLEHHLRERVVFYGASIEGVSDLVYTPTRQIRPGVYYHAMALDNLLSLKGGYKSKKLKESIKGRWPFGDFGVHLFTLLIPSVIIYVRQGRKKKIHLKQQSKIYAPRDEKSVISEEELAVIIAGKKFSRGIGKAILTRAPLICWILICVLLSFFWLELAPINWLGYFAFAEVGFYIGNILWFEKLIAFNREKFND